MKSNANHTLSDGVYTITSQTLGSLNLYCSFDYENKYAWTLIDSGLRLDMTQARSIPFTEDFPYETDDVNTARFQFYRLSYDWMHYLQSNSDYILSTCQLIVQLFLNVVMVLYLSISKVLNAMVAQYFSLVGQHLICIHM